MADSDSISISLNKYTRHNPNNLKITKQKSTGYVGISSETIKILSDIISPTISIIINKCIKISIFPDDMKIQNKTSINKGWCDIAK